MFYSKIEYSRIEFLLYNARGPRFESGHFYFYFFVHFWLKIPIAASVQTTFFGLTIIYIDALNGQNSIAKSSM